MIIITPLNQIVVHERLLDRIQNILEAANKYGVTEIIAQKLIIHYDDNHTKILLDFDIPRAYFGNNSFFTMCLNEMAYTITTDLSVTYLTGYKYHGYHSKEESDPSKHFIRFDFEPFKTKYAPLHINAPKKEWGDHLTYPDGTNLNISKLNCPIALAIFHKYSENKSNYPTDTATNQNYVDIIENGGEK